MRFDSAGPRTWLLAGAASWAILALVLALVGMGRDEDTLADDPSLVRPLPALPKPVPERLGPLTQYAEIANRPLFADDRRPHPFSLQPEGEETQAKAFDYTLTSVIITPTFKMAILKAPDGNTQPLRVKVGEPHEQLPGWQLQSVSPRSAVFVGPEGERTLELGVFDGVGGEAPTMASAPPSPDAAPVEPPPPAAVADAAAPPAPDPNASRPQPAPQQQQTEQAQMDAIRKRIEARRAQLRQEALQEQQQLRRQNQKPPVK
jgi:general secretion pathway protein N